MDHFPTTRWSIIEIAADPDGSSRHQAVSDFLSMYYMPMKSLLGWRFQGLSVENREDLLQSFVADRLLADDLYRCATKGVKRFRPYLRKTLVNYVSRQLGKKQIGTVPMVADSVGREDADPFDYEWARTVVNEMVRRVRQECEDGGHDLVWDVLDLRVIRPIYTQQEPVPIADLARRFGRTDKDISNLGVTGKRMLNRHLKRVVRGYTNSDRAADQEIKDLFAVLSNQPLDPSPA